MSYPYIDFVKVLFENDCFVSILYFCLYKGMLYIETSRHFDKIK